MRLARLARRYGDAALAIALSALLALETADELVRSAGSQVDGLTGRLWLDAALAFALTMSLVWRRRAAVLVLAIGLAGLLVSGQSLEDQPEAWALALLVAIYSAGAGVGGSLGALGGVMVVAVMAVAVAREPGGVQGPGDVTVLLLLLGGPWAAGTAMRLRHGRERALEQRTVVLEQDQEATARAAVTAERARIARELHDVVAHALSVMVLQARGGRRSQVADPGAAREAFDTIDSTGTEALAEMRRLVGALRTDDEGPTLSPQPSLRDLDALVAQVREAGLAVDVSIEGTPIDLPPGVDLAAYRILQEALTNCLRHARSATASVLVRYGDEDIDLLVTDTGHGAEADHAGSGGHGVIGMRERVAMYGGSIEIGPRESGGFAVRAQLPLRG